MSDDSRMGKPSAWASNEPAVGVAVVHRHPLTRGVRVILVLYGLALAASLGSLLWIIIDGQHNDEKQRAAVVKRVEADLDASKKAQDKKDAATNAQTQVLVCRFLLEFTQTPNVKALAKQFRCDLALVQPSPTPQPSPTATVYVYMPSASPQARPSPRSSRAPPAATHSPTTHPSPSPTCAIPLPKPLPPCPPGRGR